MKSERGFEEYLLELLEDNNLTENRKMRIETFEEAGLLTKDKGVVVRFPNGAEFQIGIVKSR